ncbi:hypothetical protein THRCLA_03215 [Thraustotheca clavata]|uniref:DNA mismatch repair proteins mutS family domain-containing protein n=1 Tax=Thraustotheca clavata TaxID=74557 RepID=A0A1W0A2R0_9STRA|nr:hypothetical protein THRCLA_03215 [Thraustotheca clavata]
MQISRHLINAKEIFIKLYQSVMKFEASLYDMIDAIARFDCYLSMARAAYLFKLTRPVLHNDITIVASNVRHPLHEIIVDIFIPNDVCLDGSKIIQLYTGENGSGKSVYLTMVGLLQYMAQIGSFVAASSATVGIVTKMFTRVQGCETSSYSRSSFTIDCNQISTMLKHCDERTSLKDGVCLMASLLKSLKQTVKQKGGPKVVITTHFLEIFKDATLMNYLRFSKTINANGEPIIVDEDAIITCNVMSTLPSNQVPLEATTALFESKVGIASSSNAFRCASLAGVDERIINRARYIADCIENSLPIAPPEDRITDKEILQKLIEDVKNAHRDLLDTN